MSDQVPRRSCDTLPDVHTGTRLYLMLPVPHPLPEVTLVEPPPPVPAEPEPEPDPTSHLLSCVPDLKDLGSGLVELTDPRLRMEEVAYVVDSSDPAPDLYTACPVSRVCYTVKWEGGGSITTRVLSSDQ
nr:E4 ORF6/7 protein [Lemur mastadenovirus]